jgi:hypothetical protein
MRWLKGNESEAAHFSVAISGKGMAFSGREGCSAWQILLLLFIALRIL